METRFKDQVAQQQRRCKAQTELVQIAPGSMLLNDGAEQLRHEEHKNGEPADGGTDTPNVDQIAIERDRLLAISLLMQHHVTFHYRGDTAAIVTASCSFTCLACFACFLYQTAGARSLYRQPLRQPNRANRI